MIIADIIKTLKINHYLKNFVVFVPLLFSMNFTNLRQVMCAFLACLAFCLMSSSVYILNDLIDIEKDKKHPIKKNRPIPSGRIPISVALFVLLVLFIFGTLLAYLININCVFVLLSYFVLNIFYSFYLKHFVLIDSCCIAIGFILRILIGCCAIGVLPSPLVILMTYFVSNFFTFSKRKLEIELNNDISRTSLKNVNVDLLKQFILINAVLSISFYITYVLDEATILRAGSKYLYLTVIPFTLIICRLFLLINSGNKIDDPIVCIEQDKTLKALFVFYIIVLTLVCGLLK